MAAIIMLRNSIDLLFAVRGETDLCINGVNTCKINGQKGSNTMLINVNISFKRCRT